MNTIDYYLSLPYTIELIREDETTWFARVVELPGCMTEGDSAPDAVAMIQDAMAGWIELAMHEDAPIYQAANDAHATCISAPGSKVSAWMIPTNEELMIARHTGRLLGLVGTSA